MIFPSKEAAQNSIRVETLKHHERAKKLNKDRALRTRQVTLQNAIRYVPPAKSNQDRDENLNLD
jgi:hypothetical protein